jgi:predicted DCC family thiol-disulfide oxidoreductase YuxK
MGAADKVKEKILFFDGVCNLCNASVNFIIDHNTNNNIKFAPLQSKLAKEYFPSELLSRGNFDTLLLYEEGVIYKQSSAAIQIAKELDFPYNQIRHLSFLPAFLRDFVYNFIARNRYRFFGKKASCRMPSKELKERFIDSPILS